jgi:hypothetical protein
MRRRGDRGDGYSQQGALTAENTVTLGRVRSSMRRTHLVQVQDSGMPCEEVHPTCAWIQLAILPQSEESQGISQSLLDVPNSRVLRMPVSGNGQKEVQADDRACVKANNLLHV